MKKEILLLSLFLIVVFVSGCSNNGNNIELNTLAECLTEKGAVMYGTQWCHFCQEQKALFGESFQSVNYVDCDYLRGKCEEAGVKGYPTWIINGKTYSSVQSLERLSELSGCQVQDEQ